ncbi:hypothetical protein M514_20156 [Trichuris suis]|uniref:Uncharacterized protein n=1 Tax=Trichuris suis TaxID=68888 RepID=A0A085NDW4_9BILA|nr:hypothetical protein M514_20156 [Trichuris suis]
MSTFNRAAVKHLAGLSIVIINKGQREKRFYRISNEKSFVLLNRNCCVMRHWLDDSMVVMVTEFGPPSEQSDLSDKDDVESSSEEGVL